MQKTHRKISKTSKLVVTNVEIAKTAAWILTWYSTRHNGLYVVIAACDFGDIIFVRIVVSFFLNLFVIALVYRLNSVDFGSILAWGEASLFMFSFSLTKSFFFLSLLWSLLLDGQQLDL